MAIELNAKGQANAKARVRAGDVDSASAWAFSSDDGNTLLGDGEDWAEYGRWHLGVDTEADAKTKAHYKYPFGKGGKVYLSALRAIRTRSAQQGHTSIFEAAGALLEMAKKKTEKKSGETEMEYRSSLGEIRSVDEQGIIEAYLTRWDTVDSYQSLFRRGAFKKTFEERKGKIRHIWNHEILAGKILDAREDDYGPWVRGQFNLDTQAGREAYAHVKAGDVDAYSFGFNAIADHVENGIRAITEVRLWECGPVIFEANAQARIVDVRAIDAPNTERPVIENELARATSDYIMEKWDGNVDEMAKNTGWTSEEIKQLRRGEILPAESRAKLADLPDTIHRAHQTLRSKAVQTLCDELRQGGLNDAERARVMGLLGLGDDWGSRMSSAVNTVRTLRESLRQSNVR